MSKGEKLTERSVMTRLSMNEITTYRWAFEEDVARYCQAGIPSIGVWRQKLADFGEAAGIALLADSGLSVSNLLWAGGFTGSDGRTYRDSIEDTEEAIRLAASLKAGCLVVYSGARAGHTHSHARRLIFGALKELESLAVEFDVTLAIEPMHAGCAGEWTFLTDLQDTLELIQAVGSPQVKLVFDTYHLGQDEAILERIPQIVDNVAIVHLGDSKTPPTGEQNRCWLGEGNIPLAEIIGAMMAAGYQGDFDVELMGEEIDSSKYADLLVNSKETFAQLVGQDALFAGNQLQADQVRVATEVEQSMREDGCGPGRVG